MSAFISDRPRETMPRWPVIAVAWQEIFEDEFSSLFPDSKVLGVGLGEPGCFRCGWLAPIPEYADYPTEWTPERRFKATWNRVGAWLERSHLKDHAFGGDADPLNLVPLCPLCHEEQPRCKSREDGIAFVNQVPRHQDLVWLAEMWTDGCCRDMRPAKGKALRTLLRAYVAAGIAVRNALSEGPTEAPSAGARRVS